MSRLQKCSFVKETMLVLYRGQKRFIGARLVSIWEMMLWYLLTRFLLHTIDLFEVLGLHSIYRFNQDNWFAIEERSTSFNCLSRF
jgi:hypothetical protein